MTASDHAIDVLNGLIETTIDSVDGYTEAANDAHSGRYREIFLQRASERRHVVAALQRQVVALGGEPSDHGTTLASAHRAFVHLREALGAGDKGIVDEVERGEDHIKAKFEDALNDGTLDAPMLEAIEAGYASVRAGHDQMRDLKHALRR